MPRRAGLFLPRYTLLSMKNLFGNPRLLTVYSAVITLVFAVILLGGFAAPRNTSFREITVQRINIVEPDGTLRMVVSDKSLFPGIILKGKEHPHPNRKTAGMLFFNDEGTENGGLTFDGKKDKDGQASSSGHLSFDEYEQDQVITIDASQQGSRRTSAITMVDDPGFPIGDLIEVTDRIKDQPEEVKRNEISKFMATHGRPHRRLYLGRGEDHSVALKLKDVEGRDRIVIEVAPDGAPAIRFLDESGAVIGQMPAKR